MSEEKITPELVNEIACNAITFQKNPLKTWLDVKEMDPKSTRSHENVWKYESPEIFVLYESGRIVYDNQLYYMNEQTRNALIRTLKAQEKAAKRKEFGQMIRYTIAIGATVIAVVVIVHNINKAVVKSKQDKKEQSTEKIQSVKDSVSDTTGTFLISQKKLQR